MFVKLGELIEINGIESVSSCLPSIDPNILENFQKTATALKRVAPKAEDFLYFSAVMMHAAEASAINDDGSAKLTASGAPVEVGWDRSGNTMRWVSNDPLIQCYKNCNGDIFPEEELVKAYKKWVGKPLCVDHKSSSVEHVRGFIVDTYYDRKLKRVVALCALDKAGYPQLARQVSTGVSTNVSMGTAVGRAVCTDCAKVARTEADFCNHMRHKSGYGEINLDLNPIELSIVVNGADPKASIKNVLAAANTLNAYVKAKENELKKVATTFTATLTSNESGDDPKNTSISINESDMEGFRKALEEATTELEQINFSAASAASAELNSGVEELDPTTPTTNLELAPPHERFASMEQLNKITKTIEASLSQMKDSLDKLTSNLTQQEESMSVNKDINKAAYYQGTEEPKPGTVQYPADPKNVSTRQEDKHMVGVDNLGGADGLAPGDLEKKRLLARADAEERALRRNAIVEAAKKSLAYPQGTTEPTKYPVDKTNEDVRNKSDKHMVGKSPFPGVGKVDELYPEDKKKKELLQRASLQAKFIKASNKNGSLDKSASSWNVYLGEDLVLTASVSELSGGRTELMYDSIATSDFGKGLISKVRKEGADKVSSLIKKAQELPPVASPVEPAADMVPEVDPGTGNGEPADVIKELADKMRDVASDMGEAVVALEGDQAEMGDVVAPVPTESVVASADSASLEGVRKGLGLALANAMRESIKDINAHVEELDMITGLYDKGIDGAQAAYVGEIVADAVKEAKSSAADGFKLITAFVKYARGTKAMLKRAQVNNDLAGASTTDVKAPTVDHSDEMMATDKELDELEKALHGLEHIPDEIHREPAEMPDLHEPPDLSGGDRNSVDDEDDNDLKATLDELKKMEVPSGTKVEVTASLSTKAGRAEMRAKLAADAVGKHSMQEAHPKGGTTIALDVKPSGDLAKFETIDEVHDDMMDMANAPVKVRKEAAEIHKLVTAGDLAFGDLDALVAEGLDKDAVSYYKKYYGQVDGGSEFATELVKEHKKAARDLELGNHKVKIARAYELAYDMADRGLCNADRPSISAQVEDIMQYNDEAFESLKNVVARHNPMRKSASLKVPQVGQFGGGDAFVSAGSSSNLQDELADMFGTNTKRGF